MNGKGDSPRNCFSEQFRANYDQIFRRKPQLPADDEVVRAVTASRQQKRDKAPGRTTLVYRAW